MSADAPRFRRETPASSGPPLRGLIALLVFFGLAAFTRPYWAPTLPEGTLVEVTGDVPRPGTYLVDPATVGAALALAGRPVEDPRVVPAGHRVHVGESVAILPPSDPLLVALPVDVNTAEASAIAAIPGVGRSAAERIVADRDENGLFYAVDDLRRVRGIGASALDAMVPFITLGDPGERPPPPRLDPNTASAIALEGLPGIGPVTAARIVVDREDNGPFATVDDLARVPGIGPKTLDRIRDRLEIAP